MKKGKNDVLLIPFIGTLVGLILTIIATFIDYMKAFVDSNIDVAKVSRKLPKEVKNAIISVSINKKFGDLGGE